MNSGNFGFVVELCTDTAVDIGTEDRLVVEAEIDLELCFEVQIQVAI